jgi:hypothetical protein
VLIPRQEQALRLSKAFIRELDAGCGRGDGCPTVERRVIAKCGVWTLNQSACSVHVGFNAAMYAGVQAKDDSTKSPRREAASTYLIVRTFLHNVIRPEKL